MKDLQLGRIQEKPRYDYLDFYKGIAISLILVHHVFQYFEPMTYIVDYITDFHVAMFYAASGVLAWTAFDKDCSMEDFISKKIRRLLIPYFIFALFGMALKTGVLLIVHKLTTAVICEEILQIATIGNGPVWFLYRFFWIEIIYIVFYKFILKKNRKFAAVFIYAIFFGLLYILQSYNHYFLMTCRSMLAGFLYLMGGFYVGKYVLHRSDARKIQGGGYGIFLLSAGTLVSIIWNVSVSFKTGYYSNVLAGWIVSASISLGGLALVKTIIEKGKQDKKEICAVKYLGKNSMVILCVHPTLLLLFSYPFSSKTAGLPGYLQIVSAILIVIILIIVELPFIRIINTYFPFLVGMEKIEKA